jgi:hypothetical protein
VLRPSAGLLGPAPPPALAPMVTDNGGLRGMVLCRHCCCCCYTPCKSAYSSDSAANCRSSLVFTMARSCSTLPLTSGCAAAPKL